MNVQCPSCSKVHNVKPEMAGKRAKCKCGGVLLIPATDPMSPPSGGAAPTPAPAPAPNLTIPDDAPAVAPAPAPTPTQTPAPAPAPAAAPAPDDLFGGAPVNTPAQPQPFPGEPQPMQPVPGQPLPGQMQQPIPGQPQQMPQQQMPQQQIPGQPQPYPQQQMPGQPLPGQPQAYPQQQMPQQQMPAQPQQMPVQQMPVQQQQMPQQQMPVQQQMQPMQQPMDGMGMDPMAGQIPTDMGAPQYGAPQQMMGGYAAPSRMPAIGLTIVAIAMSVMAGSAGLSILSEIFLEGSTLMRISRPTPPTGISSSTDYISARQRYQEELESYRSKMETATSFAKIGRTLFKIACLVGLLAGVACIVGYVFCICGPGTTRGFAIAAVCVGGAGTLIRLVLKTIPAFDDKRVDDHLMYAISNGRFADVGDKILAMLADLTIAAEFIILAVLIVMIAKSRALPGLMSLGKMAIVGMSIFAGALFLMYVWAMIEIETTSSWPLYLSWFLHWVGNVGIILGFIFLLRGLYSAKNAVQPAAAKSW